MRKLVILFAVIIALISIVFLLWVQNNNPSPLSKLSEQSTFPIYQPGSLPSGYTIDESSISLTSQALLFTAKSKEGDQTLIFTETPVPAEYDFESFYKTRFIGAQDVSSLYGRGKVGIMDNMMAGSLATDSTWILVKGPENLPASEMVFVIERLKPTHQ